MKLSPFLFEPLHSSSSFRPIFSHLKEADVQLSYQITILKLLLEFCSITCITIYHHGQSVFFRTAGMPYIIPQRSVKCRVFKGWFYLNLELNDASTLWDLCTHASQISSCLEFLIYVAKFPAYNLPYYLFKLLFYTYDK